MPGTQHYENFPVASWLCPVALRPAVLALYHFARTADDLADEGQATPQQRLDDLAAYRADLLACISPKAAASQHWPHVFTRLQPVIQKHRLPPTLLLDLLDAFEQDVRKTAEGSGYANQAELLDYCRRSANPVGRLLLHLYGLHDADALHMSDQICSALQLINFWQDLSVDIPRSRYYLPQDACHTHGVTLHHLQQGQTTPAVAALMAEQVAIARTLMQDGAPLVHRLPGRAGWELRLVVQGGLRILDKIQALNYRTLETRPTLRKYDAPLLLWRSLWM
jgi:squalene synthase HpnC